MIRDGEDDNDNGTNGAGLCWSTLQIVLMLIVDLYVSPVSSFLALARSSCARDYRLRTIKSIQTHPNASNIIIRVIYVLILSMALVVGWILAPCHSLLIIFHLHLPPSPAIAHFHLKQMMRTSHPYSRSSFIRLRRDVPPQCQYSGRHITCYGDYIHICDLRDAPPLHYTFYGCVTRRGWRRMGRILINRQLLKVIKAATNWIFRALSSRTFLFTRAHHQPPPLSNTLSTLFAILIRKSSLEFKLKLNSQ